jgi:hypothetical protein
MGDAPRPRGADATAVPPGACGGPGAAPSATAWIEIELGDGRRVRVAPGVTAEDLRGVLAVLAEPTAC